MTTKIVNVVDRDACEASFATLADFESVAADAATAAELAEQNNQELLARTASAHPPALKALVEGPARVALATGAAEYAKSRILSAQRGLLNSDVRLAAIVAEIAEETMPHLAQIILTNDFSHRPDLSGGPVLVAAQERPSGRDQTHSETSGALTFAVNAMREFAWPGGYRVRSTVKLSLHRPTVYATFDLKGFEDACAKRGVLLFDPDGRALFGPAHRDGDLRTSQGLADGYSTDTVELGVVAWEPVPAVFGGDFQSEAEDWLATIGRLEGRRNRCASLSKVDSVDVTILDGVRRVVVKGEVVNQFHLRYDSPTTQEDIRQDIVRRILGAKLRPERGLGRLVELNTGKVREFIGTGVEVEAHFVSQA